MKITELSLTNFRSFKKTQKIEFAPVTLLFGPNSVGKSTVLLALFYLQQILEKGQCDPVRIEALGDKHIGGFKNLVNGRDLGKEMIIKVSFSTADDIGATYNDIADLFEDDLAFTPDSPTADANSVSLEFRLGWSDSAKIAYVSRYTVWLDEEVVVEATSDPGLKQPVISYINYEHPLLAEAEEVGHQSNLDGMGFVSEFHRVITEPRMANDVSEGYGLDSDSSSGKFFYHVPIGFRGRAGALPLLGRRLTTSLYLDSDLHCARAEEILSDVLVAPLDNLLEFLSESLCIGPSRIVPDAMFQANPYPQQKDWYTGKAAWDALESTVFTTNEEINYWLSDGDALDIGYKLIYKIEEGESRYISLSGAISGAEDYAAFSDALGDELGITFSKEDLDVNPKAAQVPVSNDLLESLIASETDATSRFYVNKAHYKRKQITLWDIENNLAVSASEIGVGVSQLLPLVVAANTRQKGLVACEQPELHVHPRVQVAIGDLLTQMENGPSFLVETHSEHLILRLLKRIRQTTDSELPKGFNGVRPSDVSIVYLKASDQGVITERISIDEDGDFVERWPDGFFAERRKEFV